jgi:hypothetical protein
MMTRPPEIAGVARTTSFVSLRAISTYFRPALTTYTSPSSLVKYKRPSAAGRHRRRAERIAHTHTLAVEALAVLGVIGTDGAICVQGVEQTTVEDGRGNVGAIPL